MGRTPPNFLFIEADQLPPQALPMYGNPVVRAPHMQALADAGVLFDNAYCNSPLCAPSRFSMLSGRLASRIGAYDVYIYTPSRARCTNITIIVAVMAR